MDRLPGLQARLLKEKVKLVETAQGQRLLFLRLARPVAAFGARSFLVEPLRGTRAPVLALSQGSLGTPSLCWGEHDWPELWWEETRLGCGMHPLARDWAWAWPRTYEVALRIYLQRSAEEIAAWVEARQPGAWRPDEQGRLTSNLSADSRIWFSPGLLRLTRGYHTPPFAQIARDYELLTALSREDLAFDLFDGDYFVFLASGESGRSLWDYLHAQARRGRPHRWNRFVECPSLEGLASTLDECAALLGKGLGWTTPTWEELCARFAAAPVPSLPRNLTLRVPKLLFPQEVYHRLVEAQPRVMFSWHLVG